MSAREHAAAARPDQYLGQGLLLSKIDCQWTATKMIMNHLCPGGAAELITSLTELVDHLPSSLKAARGPASHVVDYAEHADHRCRQDRRTAGLVVEADVAAGHRRTEFAAAVHQTAYRLAELPHDGRIFRGPEVQTVGDGQRLGSGRCDIAVRLGQR